MVADDAGNADDRLPVIVMCGYDPDDEVWDPVEDLSGRHWRPAGARTVTLTPDTPDRLHQALAEQLEDRRLRAVLLLGRGRAPGVFSVQMRAENRELEGPGRLDALSPSLVRATLPVGEVVRGLTAAGLRVQATSEAEPDAGSYLLYRILSDLPDISEAPIVGLLRVPSDATLDVALRGIKAATAAIAGQLAPLGRPQSA